LVSENGLNFTREDIEVFRFNYLTVMEAIIDGKKFDLKQFYETTHRKAYNFAVGHCGSEAMAEEILQVAYIKLWQKHQQIHPTFSAFQSYLYTTIRNLVIKEYHRQVAERQASMVFQELQADSKSAEETEAIVREVHRALSTLPSTQQRTFRLIKIEGYTYREAAEVLSISESTVEKHMIKALRMLRHKLPHISYLLPLLACI